MNIRENQILLMGDTHSLKVLFITIQRTPNIDDLDMVSIGDNGIGFMGQDDHFLLNRINDICQKRNINLYIIRGNHDNLSVWKKDWTFSNVFLVPDYTELVFPNKKNALLVGGGISVDRNFRKAGIDYWIDEVTEYKKTNKHFDVLFCHDAPDYFNNSTKSLKNSPWKQLLLDDADLYEDALEQRTVMDMIVADTTPSYYFSGHFHNRIAEEKNKIKYRCLDICEILFFDADVIL